MGPYLIGSCVADLLGMWPVHECVPVYWPSLPCGSSGRRTLPDLIGHCIADHLELLPVHGCVAGCPMGGHNCRSWPSVYICGPTGLILCMCAFSWANVADLVHVHVAVEITLASVCVSLCMCMCVWLLYFASAQILKY